MKVIDADALLKHAGIFEVKACARGCGNSILNFAKAWLWNEVNIAPTIDAVPVVRCRECKLWLNSQLFPHSFYCLRTERVAYPDDYCSYGERKEGADR